MDRAACLLHDGAWYAGAGIELATRTSVMQLDTDGTHRHAVDQGGRRLRRGAARDRGERAPPAASRAASSTASTTCARSATRTRSAPTPSRPSTSCWSAAPTSPARSPRRSPSLGRALHDGDARGRAAGGALRADGGRLLRRPAARAAASSWSAATASSGSRAASASSAWSPRRAASCAADMVVMGTGAVPDVMLARSAKLELGESGGVRCSPTLATSAPGVWAAGDMCEYDSVLHGRPRPDRALRGGAGPGQGRRRGHARQRRAVRRGALLLDRPRRLVHGASGSA